ncbi:MAG: hypothetical protein IKD04_06705 [Clostridia bacterium]|nr:hypothetical protein [Clostridia bacterium]
MKKFILLASIALLLAVSFMVPASAETAQPIMRVAGDGETVTLTVSTETIYGGLQGEIAFDATALTYVNAAVTEGLIDEAKAETAIQLKSDGVIKFALLGNVENGASGDWFTLTFSVNTDKATEVSFNLTNGKASSVDGLTSTAFETSASYTVNGILGDINGDTKVDIKDLIRFKKYAAKVTSDIVESNADCDGNGVIEPANDMAKLVQYLIGKSTLG